MAEEPGTVGASFPGFMLQPKEAVKVAALSIGKVHFAAQMNRGMRQLCGSLACLEVAELSTAAQPDGSVCVLNLGRGSELSTQNAVEFTIVVSKDSQKKKADKSTSWCIVICFVMAFSIDLSLHYLLLAVR